MHRLEDVLRLVLEHELLTRGALQPLDAVLDRLKLGEASAAMQPALGWSRCSGKPMGVPYAWHSSIGGNNPAVLGMVLQQLDEALLRAEALLAVLWK